MHTSSPTASPISASWAFRWISFCALFVWFVLRPGFAGDATWTSVLATDDWNTAGNWTAGGPPNGTGDIATFNQVTPATLTFSANTTVDRIVIAPGSAAFSFQVGGGLSLTLAGAGIAQNNTFTSTLSTLGGQGVFVTSPDDATINFNGTATSGGIEIQNTGGQGTNTAGVGARGIVNFNTNATAADSLILNQGGFGFVSGVGGTAALNFNNSASAANATIQNTGGTATGGTGGTAVVNFTGTATAGSAAITNNGSATPLEGQASTVFQDSSSAGNAVITNTGGVAAGSAGGLTRFIGTSSASSASLTASGSGLGNGGAIRFEGDSTGGTAVVDVSGAGFLDISAHTGSVTIASIEGDGSLLLGGNTLVVGGTNASTTFSGVAQNGGFAGGTGGGLTKTGTGTFTLGGLNTYTGTTTVSDGILQAGALNAFSSGSAHVVSSGGVLDLAGFNQTIGSLAGDGLVYNSGASAVALTLGVSNASTTFSGVIEDNGAALQLVKNGTGTFTLSGANTYTGGTTINAGTLQIGAGGTTGSVAGDITDNATLAFNRSDDLTYAGVISGSGSLTKLGAGTLTLTGTNAPTGGTTITAGTLQIGAGGTTGSLSGNILDNAALAFNRSDDLTYAGAISGSGTLAKLGADTLTLTGATTLTGITTITAGTLQIGAGGTTGSLSGDITNNAALVFNRSDDLTYAGSISGTGTLTKLGADTLTLAGANAPTGGTTITAGTLQIGAGGTTGSLSGDITDNAALAFNRSDDLAYAGSISGTGTLTKLGVGTLTLTGTNTPASGTTIMAGTLQIGAGGTTGSLSGDITDNAALTFNRSDDLTYAGAISGTGSLTKLGADTLTLTGTNAPASGTTITAGTLQIGAGSTTGSLSGDIADNAALIFNRSDDLTYASAISGTGTLTKLGTGTLTLTGANAPAGGTTITAGTLQVGAGSTTGSLSGDIADNAALVFNRSDDLTYAGAISGTGTLTKLGAGTLTLTGTNAPAGGTTITAGTLQIGAAGTTGSLSGDIVDDAALVFNRSNTLFYSGSISGTGTLTKLGTAIVVLSGDDTRTGGTTITAGTLQIGAGGTTGSIAGDIVDNATLAFNRSDDLTYAGAISGTGALSHVGTGTLTLTGDNTLTGSATVAVGTLQIGAGGTTGSLSGNIFDYSALAFNRSDDLTYADTISGAGTLTKLGAGTLTLTGTNALTGGTTLTTGTLQIGAGGTTGSLSGDIADNAILVFNRSDALTYAGAISGTGTLTQLGTGTLTLTGANAPTGGTTITAGTLQVGAGGTTGSLSGDITNNGALAFNRSDDLTYSGAISGTGTLTKLGAGTLTLTGVNAPAGGTTITTGTLQIGAGGTTGSLSGDITDNAALAFNHSDALTYAGAISGTGSLTKLGVGILILTGTNTPAGGTTVTTGRLQIGAGGTTGSLSGDIVNNSSLGFNRSDDLTYAGAISGSGSFDKIGAGTLTLTGVSSYTGITSVGAGTLRVAGLLGNTAIDVSSGATLGGTGTIGGAVTVEIGGHLAPGASPGTLTINNSLTLGSESLLDFELAAPNVIGGGVNDLVDVNGDLHLGGILNVTDAGGFGAGTYRLFNFSGTLLNGRVAFGTLPAGLLYGVQTNVANQINLIVDTGAVQFWDGGGTAGNGVIEGGTQTWDNTASRWADATGVITASWLGHNAVFGGTAGTVTLGAPIAFQGMRFSTTGYLIAGDATNGLTPTGTAVLNTDAGVVATIAAPLTGSGGIDKQGAGQLVLTANNTYTGGTQISAGTLQIGAGGTAGSLSGDITNNAALAFNRSDTLTYAGVISGTGTLTQSGTGTLTLTGANLFTGLTRVDAGTLVLASGSSVAATNIAAGATLRGNGTIRGNLANGGTVSPGLLAGAGLLTINGGFTQASTGRLVVELGSTSTFDRLQISGAAALDGTLEVATLPGFTYQVGDQYQIISAASVTGHFASVLSPFTGLPLSVGFETLYAPTSVTLEFAQLPYAPFALTPNQSATAHALDTVVATGGLPTIRDEFNTYTTVDDFRAGFNQLSPQRYERWFDTAVFNTGALVRAVEGRLGETPAPSTTGQDAWATVVHREANFSGDADVAAGKLETNGLIAGLDRSNGQGLTVGGLLSYDRSDIKTDSAGGTTRAETFEPALYARYTDAAWSTEATVGYAWHDYDASRPTILRSYTAANGGDAKGWNRFADIRVNYAGKLDDLTVTPFAGLQHLRWDADAFTETGGIAALNVHEQRGESLTSRLGAQVALPFRVGGVTLTPQVSATWRHEFQQSRRQLGADFAGEDFTVLSQLPSANGWVGTVGLEVRVKEQFSLNASVTVEGNSAVDRSTDLSLGASYRF